MKITKIFHSCILLEEKDTKILIDPGSWVFEEKIAKPSDFKDVKAVLITHEHPDHFYSEALALIKKGGARIITNGSVASKLNEVGIDSDVLQTGDTNKVDGVSIRAIKCPHGIIPIPVPENTGFIIQEKVFHPGDSLVTKGVKNIQVYMTPITAPWMKLTEGVEATKVIKPKVSVPVHDGFMKYPFALNIFTKVITESGISVRAKDPGASLEI